MLLASFRLKDLMKVSKIEPVLYSFVQQKNIKHLNFIINHSALEYYNTSATSYEQHYWKKAQDSLGESVKLLSKELEKVSVLFCMMALYHTPYI